MHVQDQYITLFLEVFQEKKLFFNTEYIFPTTLDYIEKKYTNSNRDVEIPEIIKEQVITKALRVVDLAKDGVQIPFYDIIEMKKILLNK